MKTKAKLLCSFLLLWLIIILPATVRPESAIQLSEETKKLFERLQDLDLMKRNIEECFQAEKRIPLVASRSGQLRRDHAELDGKLMGRVLRHLAGTPEYERFVVQYRKLIQRPDHGRHHIDDLFAEYMRLLESGRIRFLTRLKEWQKSIAEKPSAQAQEGLAHSNPVKTVTFGHGEGSPRTESRRVVPAVRLEVGMPLSGPKHLAAGQKSVSRMVVPGMDRSGSAGTASPTIEIVDPNIRGAQERVVPLEEILMGYHHALVKGFGREPANLKSLEAVAKGVVAWDQE
jgi:hypothetical protein